MSRIKPFDKACKYVKTTVEGHEFRSWYGKLIRRSVFSVAPEIEGRWRKKLLPTGPRKGSKGSKGSSAILRDP